MDLQRKELLCQYSPQTKKNVQQSLEVSFSCPNDHCNETFGSYKELQEHCISDVCSRKRKKNDETVCEYVTRKYATMFTAEQSDEPYTKKQRRSMMTNFESLRVPTPKETIPRCDDDIFDCSEKFPLGFALKKRKPQTKYSKNQLEYLREIFLSGETGGRAYQPLEVVEMMKRATKDGKLRFEVKEWLDANQIHYHFNKMNVQLRENTRVDLDKKVERAKLHEEMNLDNARRERREAENILEEFNNLEFDVNLQNPQSHPWIVSLCNDNSFNELF